MAAERDLPSFTDFIRAARVQSSDGTMKLFEPSPWQLAIIEKMENCKDLTLFWPRRRLPPR